MNLIVALGEVNTYGGVGTSNNHVNKYTDDSVGTASDRNGYGYGGMAYYSSETCGYVNNNYVSTGCTTDYEASEIKYVVDAWKTAQASLATNARLITLDDLTDNLGMELNRTNPTTYKITVTEDTPTWVTGEKFSYWTMTSNTDKTTEVWYVSTSSVWCVYFGNVSSNTTVRPVITLSKSLLSQ